jgi:hypothetical protein
VIRRAGACALSKKAPQVSYLILVKISKRPRLQVHRLFLACKGFRGFDESLDNRWLGPSIEYDKSKDDQDYKMIIGTT